MLGARIIEDCGLAFTPRNVAESWVNYQGKNAYCTAERVAYRNIISGYMPPQSAAYKNPYREWIGAQIRADYYGYINPGDPAAAADMAWRDASISHVKNGIYGAMFVAGMLAAAAAEGMTMQRAIRHGLAQIPATSRLYEAVDQIIQAHGRGESAQSCLKGIHTRWDEHDPYDWCHVISNAEIVTMALLYATDYTQAIGMAVQAGFDTDCNGATVGSVYGMLYGDKCIGAQWSAPIHDTLDTTILGVGKVRLDEMVDMTMRHIHWHDEQAKRFACK